MTDRTHPDSGRIITSGDILLHDAQTALMYEELRAAIDDGHESMTHADALAEIAAIRAENVELRTQLEAIGAGGVSGQLMGCASIAASAGSEPVAHLWQHSETGRTRVVLPDMIVDADASWRLVGPLFFGSHPSPPEGMVGGWTKASQQLPPCRDDQLYVGINTAGFAGVFNAVADIAGNVHCMYETPEETIDVMSSLDIWQPLTPPTTSAGSGKGE